MTLVASDIFGRANGPLGNADLGGAWAVLAGSVTISGGRAVTSSARSLAVLNLPAGSQDITLDADCGSGAYKGGYALYFRVTDANNWWRLSVYASSTFTPTGGYTCTWTQYAADGTYLTDSGGSFYSDTYPATYYYGDGRYNVYSCYQNGYSSPTWTLRLEKCVAGTVTLVASQAQAAAPTHLRVIALGNAISGWCATTANATVTQRVSATDSFNATAVKHGLGYAETSPYGNTDGLDNLTASSANSAPNAPTALSPAGGVAVERLSAQRLSWSFSDPDAGDSQSKFDLRWRVGTGAWTTVTQTTPNAFYDAPAATFPLATIEWQVGTYDSQGIAGPWSASAFFSAATTPGLPLITSPASGGTIPSGTGTVDWSAPAQESYQVRKVADNAGVADTATVLYDSGEVVSATARNAPLTFPTNNRFEHVQVRIKNTGLWSSWASVRVQVSFTPPLNPLLVAIAMDAAAAIQTLISNPLGNLLTTNQASLETDTAGWSAAYNCTVARSTAQSITGAASLAITSSGVGGNDAITGTGTNGTRVTGGQVYTAVVSFRAATVGRTVRAVLVWYDTAGAPIGGAVTGADYADNTAGWTQARLTAQAPATAVYAAVAAEIVATGGAGEVHYADAVGLFPDPTGNLVVGGGSFENSLEGWGPAAPSTVALSTTRAYSGRQSLAVNTAGGAIAHAAFLATGPTLTLTTGTTYTYSAWVYSPVAATLALAVTNVGYGPDTAVAANTWTQLAHTFTGPSAGYGMLTVAPHGGVAYPAGQLVYVDAVQVVVGPTAPTWQPPATVNLATNPRLQLDGAPVIYTGWSGQTQANVTNDSTTPGYAGGSALKVVQTAAVSGVELSVPVPAGQLVSLSFYGRTTGALLTPVEWGVGAGTGASYTVGPDLGDGWRRYTLTAQTTRATGIITDIYVNAGAGQTWWVSNFQVEYGSVVTPYVDGSVGAGYSWESSDNLIANPSFETDTAGWAGLNRNLLTANQSSLETDTAGWAGRVNAGLARSTAQALVGAASLALTALAGGAMSAYCNTPSIYGVAVVPGQVYTAAASFRAATVARAARVVIDWYSGSSYLSSSTGADMADNTAGWTQGRVTGQAPANATTASLYVEVVGAAAGEVHYVDAIGLMPDPLGNLVTNPGFENGIAGWNGFGGGTIAASTTQAYAGRQSCAVTPSSNVTGGSDFRIYSDYVKASVGTVLTASAWVWSPVATTGLLQLQHDNAAGTGTLFTDQGGITAIPANTWTRLTCTATVPAGGGSERVEPVVLVNAGVTFYVDAVQVVVGSTAPPFLPPTTVNLVTNPSFEVDTAGWQQNVATAARTTAQAYVGSASLSVTAGANGGAVGAYYPYTAPAAGVPLTVSAYVKGVPGDTVQAGIGFGTAGPVLTLDGTWQRVTATAITPSSGSLSTAATFYQPTTTTGHVMYVDAVQLEAGSVATPYVDGSLGAGYAWEAAENLLPANAASFEDGTTGGWGQNYGTLANSAAQAVDGTKSLLWTNAASAGALGEIIVRTLPLSPAATVLTGSVWVRPSVTINLHAEFYATGPNTNYGLGPVVSCPANTWTRLVCTGVVPASTTTLYFTIAADAAPASSMTIYVDAAQVEQKDHATAYATGATANAATSRRQTPCVLGGDWLGQANMARQAFSPADGSWHYVIDHDSVRNYWLDAWYPFGIETVAAVAPNTTYTASAFGVHGSGAYMRIVDGTTGAVLADTISNQWNATPSNTRRAVTFTTGPTTTSVRVQFITLGQTLYLDAVQLEQKDHATPYGSTGAANATTSRRQFAWATPPAAVVSNDIYRRVADTADPGVRVAAAVAPGVVWTDYTPGSGIDYEYLVRAAGANGTTADSAWVG